MPTLMLLFLIPFIASAIIFPLSTISAKNLKRLAFLFSLIPLGLLIFAHTSLHGSQVHYPWLPALGIQFFLKLDNLALIFVYLTAILVPISILSQRSTNLSMPNIFFGLILLLQGLLIGFFTARDLALFTIFWEGMLLPLYFIINLWGHSERQQASLKFLIYMIGGSVFMIAGVLAFYLAGGSLNMDALQGVAGSMPHGMWIFLIFLIAFAVKTPLFPFHAWLPDAYTQAPTSGTILLSGLLSKAGIYGILRIGVELFPTFLKEWSPYLLGFAIAGVFYGGLSAWRQMDFKRLIAYSSFSHVNFILAGLFIWNQTAHSGAILQAFNHGITISALFLVAGWLEERLRTTSMVNIGGLAQFLPHLCWLTLFFVLSNVALPGTNNFIGELLIFFGLFSHSPLLTAILGLTIILSVIYMLRWMQKVYFQAPTFYQDTWIDIKTREFAIAFPLIVLILWIGLYPAPILKEITPISKNELISVAQLEVQP